MIPVGIAVREVEVPPGTPMAGFAARHQPSRGVLDPVTVRAFLLENLAIVAVDVCALHEDTCSGVHEAAARFGLDCIVTATHTHSGPCCARGRLGSDQPQIEEAIVRAAISAVDAAVDGARACTLEFGRKRGTGIAHDRRAGRPVDPPVSVLTARRVSGEVLGRLVHFPCHPVVMDAANLDVSGDYPAFLRDDLDAEGGTTVFVTGCAGDVNTGHSAEASYAPGTSPTRTPYEAARVGGLLADAVREAESVPVTTRRVRPAFDTADLEIAVRGRASAARERQDLLSQRDEVLRDTGGDRESALATLDTWIGWTERALADAAPPSVWTGRVGAVDLGNLLIVSLPGEPFLASAHRIEKQLATRHGAPPRAVLVLGYADGVPGYIPPREAYPDGGYEVDQAYEYYAMPGPFARGSAERLEATAIHTAHSITEGAPDDDE